MAKRKGKAPEQVIRLGTISASIFANESASENGGTSTFRTITIQRSYRDESNQTQFDTSFTVRDMPAVLRVGQLASEYVERQEVIGVG